MKGALLVVLLLLVVVGSFYTGKVYQNRRTVVDNNLCLTDKAIVTVFTKQLASWTRADVKKYGEKTYRRSRTATLNYIKSFQDVAPCSIVVVIPPDLTR